MVLSIILMVGILLIVYVYVKLQYFTLRHSLGGLSPHFFFGNLIQTGVLSGKKQIFEATIQLQHQFGDIFQFWPGSTRLIVLCNADDIRHVMTHRQIYDQADINTSTLRLFLNSALVCTKGSEYKRHANFTLPCFRRGKLIKHVDWIITCTDKVLLDQWRSSEHNYIHTDIDQKLKQLVLSMFSYIAYEHSFDLPVSHELHQALNDFSGVFATFSIMPDFLIKFLLKFSPTYHRSVKTIQRYSNMLLENERNKDRGLITVGEGTNSSLLGSFVTALNGNKTANTTNEEHGNETLSHEEILNEMLFFLLSGYESSWTALTWFIHLMSKHPPVQAKIKAELSEINNHITLEQLDSLVYLDAVVREVLRFAPPFDFTARTLNMDDHLPATQARLYKGDQIGIPIYNLSRDKRYWKIDPELFCPERFLDESADKNHHPYAFLPFGAGHRQCVGQHLVLLELKVIAARLMQHVTFGDGGMEVNAGRHHQNTATIIPKPVGVTISFD